MYNFKIGVSIVKPTLNRPYILANLSYIIFKDILNFTFKVQYNFSMSKSRFPH